MVPLSSFLGRPRGLFATVSVVAGTSASTLFTGAVGFGAWSVVRLLILWRADGRFGKMIGKVEEAR